MGDQRCGSSRLGRFKGVCHDTLSNNLVEYSSRSFFGISFADSKDTKKQQHAYHVFSPTHVHMHVCGYVCKDNTEYPCYRVIDCYYYYYSNE